MKRWSPFALAVVTVFALAGQSLPQQVGEAAAPEAISMTSQDASAMAVDAYVWGLPLVVTMRMMQRAAPNIGINRLFLRQQLTNPATDTVPLSNVDTLMASAVLDLRNGPLVLTVPEIKDRYYSFQFLDMYTEAFAYIGTRATNGEAGSWVIAPPGWDGDLPAGYGLISSSTPLVYLLGRFLVLSAGDLLAARAVMAQVSLAPLTPGQPTPAPSSLGPPPGAPMDSASAGAAFFDELGDILAANPPTSEVDCAALERFAAIGIGPGLHPAADGTAESRAALAEGVAGGWTRLNEEVPPSRVSVNGWTFDRQLGQYGDNFLLRANVAQFGWGANVLEETVYMLSTKGANGEPYSGALNHVLHFPAGELPPANAFWSLTLYGADLFLFENPAKRYAIGDRSPGLQTNPDGSLDIYMQQSPPPGHEPNWLPAPPDGFVLEMRIYLPEQSVIDGTWYPPAVTSSAAQPTATPTSAPPSTPTPTPAWNGGVGGTVMLPLAGAAAAAPNAQVERSSWRFDTPIASLAALIVTAVIAASACWYVRRRWLS